MADPVGIVKKSLVRKTTSESNVLDYGKLPPQVKELEEAVLGAVMIEQNAVNEIIDILKEDSFYIDAHQRIWRAVRLLFQNQAPIDLLTVTEQLKKNGDLDAAGGAFYGEAGGVGADCGDGLNRIFSKANFDKLCATQIRFQIGRAHV